MQSATFATTHWSVVLAAGQGSEPQAGQALELLCRACWYPLYAFVRRRGYNPEDAQDLTQEFFARLLAKHSITGANQSKGRFRSFLLATGCLDGKVRLWNADTGAFRGVVADHHNGIGGLSYGPDGRWLATASYDSTVRIWPAVPLPDYLSLEGHNQPVCALAESPDEKRLATGSLDQTAKIWDLDTGELWKTLPVGFPVISLAFSPDCAQFTTGSADQTARIWDASYHRDRRLNVLRLSESARRD